MAVALAVSAALHLALFALLLGYLASERGGGGHLLDAIEIEVVDAPARESVTPRDNTGGGVAAEAEAGGAPQQTQATAGSQTISTKSAADAPNSDAVADLAAGRGTETDTRDVSNAPASPTMRADAGAGAATPMEAGAASTTVAPAAQPGSAASSASPGAVARFNAEVRRALGRNRPRGWPQGHLLLAFSVSDTGRVENAALTQASANDRLNRLTLDWIATVDMPVPPQGLPASERRYTIPITVR